MRRIEAHSMEQVNQNVEVDPTVHVSSEEVDYIIRHAKKLPRRNAVRQFLFALLEGNLQEGSNTQPLIDALTRSSESHWRERVVAVWTVGVIPLNYETKEIVTQALIRTVQNQHMGKGKRFLERGTRMLGRLILCNLGINVLWILVNRWSGIANTFASTHPAQVPLLFTYITSILWLIFFLCRICLPFLSISLDSSHNNEARALAVRSLGRLRQPLSFGTLVKAVNDTGIARNEALFAIQEILPTLSPEQYGLHDREMIPILCRMLSDVSTSPIPWQYIIHALAMVGDKQAIPRLEWIVKVHKNKEVGWAAAEILPILCERQQRECASARLVRAATAPSEPSEVLLRPVVGSRHTEEKQLLRPIALAATSAHRDDQNEDVRLD